MIISFPAIGLLAKSVYKTINHIDALRSKGIINNQSKKEEML